MDQTSNYGIRMSGDGSQLVAETGRVSQAQSNFAGSLKNTQTASKDAAEETKRFVERLKEQSDTLGKSKTEIERYRAEQLQLTEAQKESVQSSLRQIDAFEKTERAAHLVGTAVKVATAAAITYATTSAFMVKSIIDERAELHNLSQGVGMSTEALSAYQYQMSLVGVKQHEFNMAMRTLSRNIAEAQSGTGRSAEIFRSLGGGIYEAVRAGRSLEEIAPMVTERIAQFSDGTNKGALVAALMGEQVAEVMIPALNQGAAGFRSAWEEAKEFGKIVGGDAAKAADEFNTNIVRTQALLMQSKNEMVDKYLPVLNMVLQRHQEASKIGGGPIAGAGLLALAGMSDPSIFKPESNWQREFDAYQERMKNMTLPKAPALPGSGGGRGESDYARMITQATEMSALAEAELETTQKLTQAERALEKLYADIYTGKLKLTDAERLEIEVELNVAAALQREAVERERLKKATEEGERARMRSMDSVRKELQHLEDQNQRLKEHNDKIGLTHEQLGALTIARAEESLAIAQQNAFLVDLRDSTEEEIQNAQRRIELARELVQLTREGAAKTMAAEQKKLSDEATKRMSDNIERGITDSIIRGFDKGKSFMENFKDSMVNTFKTAILTPIIQPIVRPVANAISGMVQGAMGSIFGGGGGLGSILTPGGGFGGGMDIFGGLGGLFGGGSSAGMMTAADLGVVGAGSEALAFGGAGMAGIGAALPWVGAGLFAANALGIFGGGGGAKGSQVGLIRQGADNHYSIGQMNVPGGEGNYPLYASMLSRLNDPNQYDQGMLGQYVDRYVDGGAGESAQSMVQKLLQLIEPAHQAALKVQADQLKAQQDTAAAAEKQVQLQQQLVSRENQLMQSITSMASGIYGKLGIDSLQAATDGLVTSDFVAPLDRFSAARQQVGRTFDQAMGGDLNAVQDFPQLVQTALGIGRDVFASGPQFQEFFMSSNRMLNDLLAHQRDIQTDIMHELNVTTAQAGHETVAEIRAQTRAIISALADVRAELGKLAA